MTIEELKIENKQCQSPGRFLSLCPQILTFDTGELNLIDCTSHSNIHYSYGDHRCCCEQLQMLGFCSAHIAFENGGIFI